MSSTWKGGLPFSIAICVNTRTLWKAIWCLSRPCRNNCLKIHRFFSQPLTVSCRALATFMASLCFSLRALVGMIVLLSPQYPLSAITFGKFFPDNCNDPWLQAKMGFKSAHACFQRAFLVVESYDGETELFKNSDVWQVNSKSSNHNGPILQLTRRATVQLSTLLNALKQ